MGKIRSLIVGLFIVACIHACSTGEPSKEMQADAFRRLGEAYLMEGKEAAAFKKLSDARKLNPDDPKIYYALGIFYFNKQRYDLAIESYQKCLELDPASAAVRNNLGVAYLATGAYDLAIQQFEELSDNYVYATPHFPMYNLGVAYFKKNEFEKAERYFLNALDLEPEYTPAMLELGRTYLKVGKIDAAVEILNKGIKLAPTYTELYFELGKAYALKHDYKNAFTSLEKVITLAPESAIAKEAKELLNKKK